MCESPEICGCINAENLQNTTGSPGGDTSKSQENINHLFISLVLTLSVLFFAGTYFHDDKLPYIAYVYYRGFLKQMLVFHKKFSKLPVIVQICLRPRNPWRLVPVKIIFTIVHFTL